jgi:cytochrome bd ubiquinol oxidase subunit I
LTYAIIFTAGTYYILRLLQIGPSPSYEVIEPAARMEAGRPKRPMSLPDERIEPAE